MSSLFTFEFDFRQRRYACQLVGRPRENEKSDHAEEFIYEFPLW